MSKALTCMMVWLFAGLAGGYAQEATSISLEDLKELMNKPSDKVQVFNFWATWCGPCIKELPAFEHAAKEGLADVHLVSLDYDLNPSIGKVNRFVKKKALTSHVYFLTEDNPNSWIDKVDARWSGSIPATIVIYPDGRERAFVEGMLVHGELENLITRVQKD